MDFVVSNYDSPLARTLSKRLGCKNVVIPISQFADTESYISTELPHQLKQADVLVVVSVIAPINNGTWNHQLWNLGILLDYLERCKPGSVRLLLPYLPYSRQRLDYSNSALGPFSFLARVLNGFSLSKVYASDLHDEVIRTFLDAPLIEVSMTSFWKHHIDRLFIDTSDCIVVSPDKGGMKRAAALASLLNIPVTHIEKTRTGPDQSKALHLAGQVKSKKVIIVDDILDTGSTASNAAELVVQQGANGVIGFFTHGLFSEGALRKVQTSSFQSVHFSNTLTDTVFDDEKLVNLDCDDYIADAVALDLSKD